MNRRPRNPRKAVKKLKKIDTLRAYDVPEDARFDTQTGEKLILREKGLALFNPNAVNADPDLLPYGSKVLPGDVYLVEMEDGTKLNLHESQIKEAKAEAPAKPERIAKAVEVQPSPDTVTVLDKPAPLVQETPGENPEPVSEQESAAHASDAVAAGRGKK